MPEPFLTPGPHRVVSEDALRRWKKRRRRLRRRLRWVRDGLIVVLALAVVVIAVHEHGSSSSSGPTLTTVTTEPNPFRVILDVKISGCSFATNAAVAHLTITNHADASESYVVNVAFGNGKKLFTAGEAAVNFLHPGAQEKVDAAGITIGDAPKVLKCYITRVQRTP